MDNNMQHQERVASPSDWEVLQKLSDYLNFNALSTEQQSVALIMRDLISTLESLTSLEYTHKKLLQTAKEEAWPIVDVSELESLLSVLRSYQTETLKRIHDFQDSRAAILAPLLRAGRSVVEAQERERDRIRLEEWRKRKYQK